MSDIKAQPTTRIVGYFNPNPYPILVEVSEANIKVELKPNEFIRDRNGHYINDPIFDDYVQPRGLSRSIGKEELPVRFVPRLVKSTRPPHSVSQATAFVRDNNGRTQPVYAKPPQEIEPTPENRNPITGMTVEKARQLGLIGKPRLVAEDYGADETTGAPSHGKPIPSIKYSIESKPRIQTAAPLNPEMTEIDPDVRGAEAAHRQSLQNALSHAGKSPENFNPASVRPNTAHPAPVPLQAPEVPTRIERRPVQENQESEPQPAAPAKKGLKAVKAVAQRVLPKKKSRVAKVIEETETQETVQETENTENMSGVIQPLEESTMPEPVLETPPQEESGKRFICAADGKAFNFRSELERYVKRKYPGPVAEQLMRAYPPDPGAPE